MLQPNEQLCSERTMQIPDSRILREARVLLTPEPRPIRGAHGPRSLVTVTEMSPWYDAGHRSPNSQLSLSDSACSSHLVCGSFHSPWAATTALNTNVLPGPTYVVDQMPNTDKGDGWQNSGHDAVQSLERIQNLSPAPRHDGPKTWLPSLYLLFPFGEKLAQLRSQGSRTVQSPTANKVTSALSRPGTSLLSAETLTRVPRPPPEGGSSPHPLD